MYHFEKYETLDQNKPEKKKVTLKIPPGSYVLNNQGLNLLCVFFPDDFVESIKIMNIKHMWWTPSGYPKETSIESC